MNKADPQPAPTPARNRNDTTAAAAAKLLPPSVAPDSGGGSLFGLGAASSLPVTGALFPVPGATAGKPVTAEETVKAFSTLNNPSLVAQIQKQLLLGGFYSGDYTPNYGVLNKKDIDAFSELVGTAAKTGADVQDYLGRQAQFGAYQGVAAAVANRQQQQARTISQEDPRALSSLIEKEFQSILGHKPNPAERAGFVSAFNAAYTLAQQSNYNMQDAAATRTPGKALTAAQRAAGLGADDSPYSDPTDLSTAPAQATPGSRAEFLLADQAASEPHAFQPQMPDLPSAATAAPVQVTQQQFDPAAFAEDYTRRTHPAEAGAHDVTGQFSNFLDILKGMS